MSHADNSSKRLMEYHGTVAMALPILENNGYMVKSQSSINKNES